MRVRGLLDTADDTGGGPARGSSDIRKVNQAQSGGNERSVKREVIGMDGWSGGNGWSWCLSGVERRRMRSWEGVAAKWDGWTGCLESVSEECCVHES